MPGMMSSHNHLIFKLYNFIMIKTSDHQVITQCVWEFQLNSGEISNMSNVTFPLLSFQLYSTQLGSTQFGSKFSLFQLQFSASCERWRHWHPAMTVFYYAKQTHR